MAQLLRLFIALDLPASIRAGLARELERLARLTPPKAVRWARPEGIHLTLKFLGDTPEGRVGEIAEMLAEAARASSRFKFEVGGLGFFPNARQPRAVWVGLSEPSGKLAELQKRVEDGAARLGFPREERGFHPHLTLARSAKDVRPPDQCRLGEVLSGQTVPSLGEVEADEVFLFRSQLQPTGAIYTRLKAVRLEG